MTRRARVKRGRRGSAEHPEPRAATSDRTSEPHTPESAAAAVDALRSGGWGAASASACRRGSAPGGLYELRVAASLRRSKTGACSRVLGALRQPSPSITRQDSKRRWTRKHLLVSRPTAIWERCPKCTHPTVARIYDDREIPWKPSNNNSAGENIESRITSGVTSLVSSPCCSAHNHFTARLRVCIVRPWQHRRPGDTLRSWTTSLSNMARHRDITEQGGTWLRGSTTRVSQT